MLFFRQSNYRKSNSITSINFPISPAAKLTFAKLLGSKSEAKRQELGTILLDELSDLAQIDIVKLKISSARQYHKKYKGRVVSKLLGYYRPQSHYIYITNRTAVQGKILASKTFVSTLLHEWLHHYDFKKLKLNSIHTAGFYARLKDLKTKLGYFKD
jgi:hypothetical protein